VLGVEFVVDHDLHMQCHTIVNDLHAHNVTTAIAWCTDNGSRLRRLASQLEFQLRLQEFVELVRSDKKLDAIQYAQSNLTPISLQSEDETTRKSMMESIQEAMATLAYKSPDQCGVESYSRLFSVERWETLKESFRTTFCLVYGIHNPPALCIALHAGLSSLNTRTCHRNREAAAASRKRRIASEDEEHSTVASSEAGESASSSTESKGDRQRQSESETAQQRSKKTKTITVGDSSTKSKASGKSKLSELRDVALSLQAPPVCPTCSDVGGQLCSSLPFAHHPHSRLVCRVTERVMDEHNPPVALPNGYVFSKHAIQQLTSQEGDVAVITCPVTRDKFATSALKPVYIL
jgi:macrophage erythroblast attacher